MKLVSWSLGSSEGLEVRLAHDATRDFLRDIRGHQIPSSLGPVYRRHGDAETSPQVRQRVGLLQPPRRVGRAHGQSGRLKEREGESEARELC